MTNKIPTDWTDQFLPLEEIIRHMPLDFHDVEGNGNKEPVPRAGVLLQHNEELLREVSSALAKRGFRRFALEDSGSFALLLKTTDNQLIRIGHPSEKPRQKTKLVLDTQESMTVRDHTGQSVSVEIFPGIHRRANDRHVAVMQAAALEEGYMDSWVRVALDKGWSADWAVKNAYIRYGRELCARNLRLLKDDTPLIVDADSLTLIGDREKSLGIPEMIRQIVAPRVKGFPQYSWETADGVWKQHVYYPELKAKQIKDVVTEHDLERLSALEENKAVVDALQRGLYRGEVGAALMDAAADGGNENNPKFAQRFREELEARDPRLGPDENGKRKRPDKSSEQRQQATANASLSAR